jgi:recombinational DNA repair protein RecT
MARKTAVRALAPYLPQTAELAAAQRLDDTVRTDLAASFDTVEVEHVDNEADEAPE